jgi:hypothetical protein
MKDETHDRLFSAGERDRTFYKISHQFGEVDSVMRDTAISIGLEADRRCRPYKIYNLMNTKLDFVRQIHVEGCYNFPDALPWWHPQR